MTPRSAHPIPGYETLLGEGPKPVRLQLSRAKGFNLQALSREVNGLAAVNVARPSKWGNPFTVENTGRVPAVLRFACEVAPLLDVTPLFGRNLACWCGADQECHADVLLELAGSLGIPRDRRSPLLSSQEEG